MFGMCQLGSAVEWPVGVYAGWILNAYLYGFTHSRSFNPTLAKPRDCLCYKKMVHTHGVLVDSS
jgi:hypothetical protein